MVVACCKHSLSHGKGNVFQFRSVQLFHGSIVGIAIDVYDGLGQVSTKLQLGNVLVCFAQVVRSVRFKELDFAGENSGYLLGELPVFDLFIVEEFGAFGGVVDDF